MTLVTVTMALLIVRSAGAMTRSTPDLFRPTASQAVVFGQQTCTMARITKGRSLTTTIATGVCVDPPLTFAAVAFAQLLSIRIVPATISTAIRTTNLRTTSLAVRATGAAIITMRASNKTRYINFPRWAIMRDQGLIHSFLPMVHKWSGSLTHI